MEAQYIADRSLLLALWHQHPDWSTADLAQATGRSPSLGQEMESALTSRAQPLRGHLGSLTGSSSESPVYLRSDRADSDHS
jgi:hypothetical protein